MHGLGRTRIFAMLGMAGALALLAPPTSGQDGEAAGLPIDNQAVVQNCSGCHTPG